MERETDERTPAMTAALRGEKDLLKSAFRRSSCQGHAWFQPI